MAARTLDLHFSFGKFSLLTFGHLSDSIVNLKVIALTFDQAQNCSTASEYASSAAAVIDSIKFYLNNNGL